MRVFTTVSNSRQTIISRLLSTLLCVVAVPLGCGGDSSPGDFPDDAGTADDARENSPDEVSAPDAVATDDGSVDVDSGSTSVGGGRGEPCDNGCADDLVCLASGAGRICAGLCDPNEYTGCERSESCNVMLDDERLACSPTCDLLTSEGCPAGSACTVFADDDGAVYKACEVAGTRTQWEECGVDAPCARGYTCAYYNPPGSLFSAFMCYKLCDLEADDGGGCGEGDFCGSAPDEIASFATIDGVGACR